MSAVNLAGDAPLLLLRKGAISRLVFNRPAVLNAIDHATSVAFLQACRSIAADPENRVIVMSGTGKAFVAGGDLAALSVDPVASAKALIAPLHEGLAILAELPQPLIGCLHGSVAGAGVGLALACDLAIAAEGTRFNLAYAKVGTSLDASSSWGLPRVVGLRKALELALLADTFDAAEALHMGLVNRVVPAAELASVTDVLAQRLAAGPTAAYGQIKKLLRSAFSNDLRTHLDAEQAAFCACAETVDFAIGLEAFLAKRPAAFSGR